MSEESQSDSDLELLELRNFILRIPGEHFFCESVDLPSHLSVGDEQKEEEVIEEFSANILIINPFYLTPKTSWLGVFMVLLKIKEHLFSLVRW